MAAGDSIRFIRACVRSPARVGAVAPSSRFLARAMVAGLSVGPGESVLEYGPGTGPFTAKIIKILPRVGSYLGIERDPAFVQLLRKRYPGVRFVEASAELADRLHAKADLGPVRAIISGLPFASLPARVQDGVVRGLDKLMQPGSEFRTFQYVHAYGLPTAVRFRRRMASLFGPPASRRIVLCNLPPAFVLTWRR